eukprot:6190818-Pleurochrysis_carterae.AAC.2
MQEYLVRNGKVRARSSKDFEALGRVKRCRVVPKEQKLAVERMKLELTCLRAFELMYTGKIPRVYDNAGALHEQYESVLFDL